MALQSKQTYSLSELGIGDRFYFLTDKKKEVKQVVRLSSDDGKKWAHKGRTFKADIRVKNDKDFHTDHKGDTAVIFLRSTL